MKNPWMRWTLMACAALVACAPPSPVIDAAAIDAAPNAPDAPTRLDSATCVDNDNDGHPSAACGGDDCDDNNPRRNPGVQEVCDNLGVDEDCDPCTVAEVTQSRRGGDGDRDEDGFARTSCFNRLASGSATPVCSNNVVALDGGVDGASSSAMRLLVSSTEVRGTDCADDVAAGGATRFPGASETCNGLDDDCDGDVDEGLSMVRCFTDNDRDTYATAGSAVMGMAACGACPAGTTQREPMGAAVDCDDANAARFPMNVENCDNVDNDCNASTSDGANDSRVGNTCAIAGGVGRCGSGVSECTSGAITCRAQTALLEMCNGQDDDCDGNVDEALCVDSTVDAMGVQSAPTGYGACVVSGQCNVAMCVSGRANCDGASSNGCETDVRTSVEHCGQCGDRCVSGACMNGRCVGVTDDYVQIDVGRLNSCAVSATGYVLCWGDNARGQLNDGTTLARDYPVASRGISDAVEVAVGDEFCTCVRHATGRVTCWGAPEVTSTASIVDAVDISAGHGFACAVRATGSVVCWGRYARGELGNGTVAGSAAPTAVVGITDAVEVEVSASHVCARRRTGQVACWGDNRWGQLGDGTTTDRSSPVAVTGITNAVAIDVAGLAMVGAHSCAVRADGTLACWGSNASRQLGDGTTTARSVAVGVAGIVNAVDVTLGASTPALDQGYTIARLRDQRVLCWGANGAAQCGQGSPGATVSMPVEVTGFHGDVLEVSAGGGATSCARRTRGTIECWGANTAGQAGSGTRSTEASPTPVNYIANTIEVDTGLNHTCALRQSGRVYCWGNNANGQLGNGTLTGASQPIAVTGIADAIDIAVGSNATCSVLASGDVRCWGANSNGQIGDGTTMDRTTPTPVASLSAVSAIELGNATVCALRADGTLACWGKNNFGQIGSMGPMPQLTPRTVPMVGDVRSVAAGSDHVCALQNTGALWCWGWNVDGQLGNGMTYSGPTAPTRVSTPVPAVRIATGGPTTFATAANGEVFCWGRNDFGQCGNGTTTASTSPAGVPNLLSTPMVFGGSAWALGLAADRTVFGWGQNTAGIYGDGTNTSVTAPRRAQPASAFVSLSTPQSAIIGTGHACGLTTRGRVLCWGFNGEGRLGNGNNLTSLVPVRVVGM